MGPWWPDKEPVLTVHLVCLVQVIVKEVSSPRAGGGSSSSWNDIVIAGLSPTTPLDYQSHMHSAGTSPALRSSMHSSHWSTSW